MSAFKTPSFAAIGIGILSPLTALLWYYPILRLVNIINKSTKYTVDFESYKEVLFIQGEWVKVVSIGAFLNIAVFFYLLNKGKDNAAVGMFYGTLFTAVCIAMYKYL